MEFVALEIEGVQGIIEETHIDSRGSFTRLWDSNSMLGSNELNQSSIVFNPLPGTLRGLHYQSEPFSENKVVECVSGKVFDVIVDLRKESPTYRKHLEVTLGPSETYLGLFVPAGCAHGYLTLEQNSILVYFMDKAYSPESARGIHWSDPKRVINWPRPPSIVSKNDSSWPEFLVL
jgi:dTDP-4-dehydrorhamnose 3,5-epimerase